MAGRLGDAIKTLERLIPEVAPVDRELELRLEELEAAEAPEAVVAEPDRGIEPDVAKLRTGRHPLPDHLPRREVVLISDFQRNGWREVTAVSEWRYPPSSLIVSSSSLRPLMVPPVRGFVKM